MTTAQPSGIVTFLFSDIEGSTRRWETQPELMKEAFARQERIMRKAMAAHRGYVYKMIGDAFQVAFVSAADALAAAVEAQQALHAEQWGQIGPIKVRMALHTGMTEERGDDYVGPLLNRVARLMSAGYGGQILLTQATFDQLNNPLPDGVVVKDMGERRLRDLIRAEHVYQAIIHDLPADFPPLKTLDYRPHNLPVQLTSFVGRAKEMADVKRLLSTTRLLTLTGAGGAGKTRLSMQAAAEVIDHYQNGVMLVELAPLAEPALVPQVIANTLNIAESPGSSLLDALINHMRDKEMLLLLDNCEHLVEACATLVHKLLSVAPKLKVMASSREPLRIAGEVTYRVPSLQTPDPKARWSVDSLAQYESVQLFIDRAMAVQPDFEITPANAPAIAQICRRLDGIPLAIELAAARVNVINVEKIAARLNDRFKLLTGGDRTALPRQQTLRAAIDWSYSLLRDLPPSERVLLRRVAVFAGEWTPEVAEEVCIWEEPSSSLEREDVLDLVGSLVNKSLVVMDQAAGADARYHLLETIREYALNKLREAGEETQVRARHAAYFVKLAEATEPMLKGKAQLAGMTVLNQNFDDLRTTLDWLAGTEPHSALRLAVLLGRYWEMGSHFSEGRAVLARMLKLAVDAPPALRAEALGQAGLLTFRQGDYALAESLLQEALSISQTIGNDAGTADAMTNLGATASARGDYAHAREWLEQGLSLARRAGDDDAEAYALVMLGNMAYGMGDERMAQRHYEDALVMRRRQGDEISAGKLLHNLGSLAHAQNDLANARSCYEESLACTTKFGNRWMKTGTLVGLGNVAYEQNDYGAARRYYEESLAIANEIGEKSLMGYALEGLGNVARETGNLEMARHYLRDSLTLRRQIGTKEGMLYSIDSIIQLCLAEGNSLLAVRLLAATRVLRDALGMEFMPVEQNVFNRSLAMAAARMSSDAFDQAWIEGKKLSIDQAARYALNEPAQAQN
jgi:predicted ATPase/class 3 adenylate cyclase/Tfp pilus assembly protein PilF